MIISHDNFTSKNYPFSNNYSFWIFYIALEKTVVYIINRKIHGCLEIQILVLVLIEPITFNTRSPRSLVRYHV